MQAILRAAGLGIADTFLTKPTGSATRNFTVQSPRTSAIGRGLRRRPSRR